MKPGRVTMQDVADLAGVSKSTVSLAFRDSKKLAESTVSRVMQVADSLGYTQDPAARMLRTRKTNSLGILLPQQIDRILENPYYSMFMQGVGAICQREGLTLLLVPPLRGSMLKAIPYAAVDGFIVCGLEEDRGEVSALKQRGVPAVMVDGETHDGLSSISLDESPSTIELIRHVLSLGHQRIALLVIDTDEANDPLLWRGSVRRRMDATLTALAEAGLSLDNPNISIMQVPCTREGGATAFAHLWSQHERPTAIVAFSDVIALGVLEAAHRAGVDVPSELSITGFDDIEEAASAFPPLTTVHQPIVTKGRLAAEFLVNAMAGVNKGPRHERLAATLFIRDSTAHVPQY